MSDGSPRMEPVLGVLLTHGEMGKGMIDAVRRIAGDRADLLVSLTNHRTSPDTLREALDSAIGDRTAIIFTDLGSGSCAAVARICCAVDGEKGRSDNRAVVFGVNLPILLDFLFHQEVPLDELLPRLVEKGRTGVTAFPAERADDGSPASP